MTWLWRALPKSFRASSDRMAQRGRDHLRAGEAAPREERVQVGRDQVRAGTGTGRRTWCGSARGVRSSWRTSATSAATGRGWSGRSSSRASRQLGEALFLEDRGDGRRAERLAVAGQGAADVVDGEVLLPQGDDLFPQPFLLAGRSALACGRDEEVAFGLIAELMDEDAKAPRCVAEASGRLGGGETVDEEGPEGFVLPMGGVGGLQEAACQR